MEEEMTIKGLSLRIIQEMSKMTDKGERIKGFEICGHLASDNRIRDRSFYDTIQRLKYIGLIESYSYYNKEIIVSYIKLTDVVNKLFEFDQALSKVGLVKLETFMD